MTTKHISVPCVELESTVSSHPHLSSHVLPSAAKKSGCCVFLISTTYIFFTLVHSVHFGSMCSFIENNQMHNIKYTHTHTHTHTHTQHSTDTTPTCFGKKYFILRESKCQGQNQLQMMKMIFTISYAVVRSVIDISRVH